MKMAKKLLALVLTGVMAMSVLTGCGSTASRQAAGKLEGMLEGMLKEANPNATVEVGSEELANKAIEVATTADGKLKEEKARQKSIVAALKNANKDEYVWYACFKAEGMNKTEKAQAISKVVLIGDGKAIDEISALNGISLKNNGYKPGDEFVLSMKEFTVTSDDGKTTTDWIMAVVTCKAVENK